MSVESNIVDLQREIRNRRDAPTDVYEARLQCGHSAYGTLAAIYPSAYCFTDGQTYPVGSVFKVRAGEVMRLGGHRKA